MALVVIIFLFVVASFVAGAKYGRGAEKTARARFKASIAKLDADAKAFIENLRKEKAKIAEKP